MAKQLVALLQTALPYLTQRLEEDVTITSIETNSKLVKEGSLFIAITGYTFDAHNKAIIAQVVANGAAAIVAEKPIEAPVPVIYVKDTKRVAAPLANAFYDRPTSRMKLVGVTGTNGKTTVTQLIRSLFQAEGKTTGLIGTNQIEIGDRQLPVTNTTPEAVVLQQTFAEMVEANVEVAAMEVSSHGIDLGRIHGCEFDVAVFTNLTQDHLDYHGTMEEYERVKGLLFAQLGSSYETPKFAILNRDDKATEKYYRSTQAHVLTYGIEGDADFRAEAIRTTGRGTEFTLQSPEGPFVVVTKLIGRFNVYNVLAAIAVCYTQGMALGRIVELVAQLDGVRGRFEVVDAGQPFPIVVDYAHTPDSLQNVIETANELANGRTIVIVGCGGDRDKTKRPIMARVATTLAEHTIITSDNPRSENPEHIIADMVEGVASQRYEVISDRRAAIERAIALASEEQFVLIAGKGHETYQIIGKETLHFDDREEAILAVERMTAQ